MSKRLGMTVCLIAGLVVLLCGCRPEQQAGNIAETQQKPPKVEAKKVETRPPAAQKVPSEGVVDKAAEMLESEEPATQVKAVQALAQALPLLPPDEAKEALKQLIAIAKDSSRPWMVRDAAIGGLGVAAALHDEAAQTLVELANSPDPEVRKAVVQSVAFLANRKFARDLVEKLTHDADPGVSSAAIQVRSSMLARLKSRKALEKLIGDLGNPVGDASAKAAIQLAIRGGEKPKEVLPLLVAALKRSTNPRQRHAIVMCIAMICAGTNPQQEKFARLARTTKKTAVRLHPAVTEGVQPLVEALRDPDPYVREIAAQGLGYIGDARAAPALGRALSDPSVRVRRRAAAALVTVPAKAAQAELERALRKDPDATVRRYAVEALGWIGDNSVVPALIAATRDASARVRRYAALELGRRKARQALEALIALFDDPDEDVRWQAVLAVGKMRDKRATDALIRALDDPAPQVANAAERALQKLGIAKRRETHLRS